MIRKAIVLQMPNIKLYEGRKRMILDTEMRIQEIERRTMIKRQKRDSFINAVMSVVCMLILICVGVLMNDVQNYGIADVNSAYGSVLLREGACAYILVGIIAFVIGVSFTVICIRLHGKNKEEKDRRNKA